MAEDCFEYKVIESFEHKMHLESTTDIIPHRRY